MDDVHAHDGCAILGDDASDGKNEIHVLHRDHLKFKLNKNIRVKIGKDYRPNHLYVRDHLHARAHIR